MLPVSWDIIRLFFHVLAATVWVGGQLTLAALVPALRRFGAEVPRAAARRFNQVTWIAFAVLIVTGIWNVAAVSSEISHSASYRDTLIVKLVVVGISGLTAALHARARSTDTSRLAGGKGRPACFARVRVLRLVEPTAFRADAVRPAGRVAAFLMLGGFR